MAKLVKGMQIKVPPDVYEELYTLKGPHRTFGQIVRELLDALYPPEKEDDNQTTLAPTCPECDEILDDGVCPGCGYPDEEDD